jgi:D-alanyl-D-alanine dipeptidase
LKTKSSYIGYVLGLFFVQNIFCDKSDVVDIQSINPNIRVELRYAMHNNFTGHCVYPEWLTTCYVLRIVAEKLDLVQQDLEKIGFGLKVWDGLRTLSAQKSFWEICPDERYVAPPSKGGRHTRGTTVDVTLVYLQNDSEVSMPTEFDNFTEKAHRDYMDFSDEVLAHRNLLEDVMQRHGFKGLKTEWWHFDIENWQDYPPLEVDFSQLS